MNAPSPRPTSSPATDARQPELRGADLPDVEARDLPRPDMVTAVIRQQVDERHVQAYESWLHRVIPIAARFPGHRGTQVIRPSGAAKAYTITIHFDTLAHAEDWFRSEARQVLLQEVAHLLAGPEEVRTVTGLEFWFEPPAATPGPRRIKQALATLSVIFPLTTLLGLALGPLFGSLPHPWGRVVTGLLVSTITVFAMTYLIMPRYTRRIAHWLAR